MIDKIKLSFGAYTRQKFAITLKGSQQLGSFYSFKLIDQAEGLPLRQKSKKELLDYKPTLEHGHGFIFLDYVFCCEHFEKSFV